MTITMPNTFTSTSSEPVTEKRLHENNCEVEKTINGGILTSNLTSSYFGVSHFANQFSISPVLLASFASNPTSSVIETPATFYFLFDESVIIDSVNMKTYQAGDSDAQATVTIKTSLVDIATFSINMSSKDSCFKKLDIAIPPRTPFQTVISDLSNVDGVLCYMNLKFRHTAR